MKLTEFNSNIVNYKGIDYTLTMAFPYVLKYFELANDDGLATIEKMQLALQLFCKSDAYKHLSIDDQAGLFKLIFDQKINLRESKLASKLFKSDKKTYDFEIDAGRIQASFLMQYGVDLSDADIRLSMDWEQFNALLDGLNDNTPFREVIRIRTTTVPDNADADARNQISKLKTLYALGDSSGDEPELTLEQQMAGMDRVERIKYIAKLRKEGKLKG